MKEFVRRLRIKSERYHMQVHILIGVACGYLVSFFFPGVDKLKMISVGILGNLMPDLDHFLFLYIYGRGTEYSRKLRELIGTHKIRDAVNFAKRNHKFNNMIYSHNMLSVMAAFALYYYFYTVKDSASLSVFFLSWTTHYVFDIFEDFLFFSKPNPNWFLKFSKKPKGTLL